MAKIKFHLVERKDAEKAASEKERNKHLKVTAMQRSFANEEDELEEDKILEMIMQSYSDNVQARRAID